AVEQVHGARTQLVNLTGLLVGEGAPAFHHPHRLHVVAVVEVTHRAGLDGGLVEREADTVVGEDDPFRPPGTARHNAFGSGDLVSGAHDHAAIAPVRWMGGSSRR